MGDEAARQPMESRPGDPVVWALLDDRAGNRSQCLGVVEALGHGHEALELRYGPLANLPNAILGATFLGLATRSRMGLAPPWPAIVIAAGRRTAPVVRRIKRLAGDQVFAVQIMDPGSGRDEFDLIAVPRHDGPVDGSALMTITGAPHPLTQTVLDEANAVWAPRLAELPTPRITVVVGGSTRRRPFTAAMARELGIAVNRMANDTGGSLMVTTSRRTDAAAESALVRSLTAPAQVHRWGDVGDNPYRGFLALADVVVVTGDSVSMCSEACAGSGPVYIFAPPGFVTDKHARLHQELYARGLARPLSGDAVELWSHAPLNAAAEIAAEIRRRLGA